jgi:hypothetical protein
LAKVASSLLGGNVSAAEFSPSNAAKLKEQCLWQRYKLYFRVGYDKRQAAGRLNAIAIEHANIAEATRLVYKHIDHSF